MDMDVVVQMFLVRLMWPQAPVGHRTLPRVVPQMKHIIASIMSKLISTLRLIAARAEGKQQE